MKEQTRNVLVGLTMLAGLAMLAGMTFLFAGRPRLFRGGYTVQLLFPTTAEAQEGDPVHLAGIRVGEIASIRFAGDDPRKGVIMDAHIYSEVRIPANVDAFIYSRGLTGGAYIELKPDGTRRLDPRTGKPLEFLPRDFKQPIQGYVKTGLVPDEFKDALSGIAKLADNLNKLISPEEPAATAPATGPATGQATGQATRPAGDTSLRITIRRLNNALQGMDAMFGDAENQKNLKTALANLAKASEQASAAMESLKQFANEASETANSSQKVVSAATLAVTTAGESVQRITRKVVEDADRLGQFLTTLNNVALKLEKGEGSAGKLLNDPGLYNGLLDTARELNTLLKDLRDLVAQWKEKGIGIKLK